MPQTIVEALTACGVMDINSVLLDGLTCAERVSDDVFDDDFHTCINLSFSDLEDKWKNYAALTQAQGQIRLKSATKKRVKALVHWSKKQLRLVVEPADGLFPVHETPAIIKRYHAHLAWTDKAKKMVKTALPKQFSSKVKWIDWKDHFVNFLRTQPGRNGIPLSYVIRENELPIQRQNSEFLDDFVDRFFL